MAQDRSIRDALDRFGADFSTWPDPARASEARRLARADRDFRARLDTAVAIDAGLQRLRMPSTPRSRRVVPPRGSKAACWPP